MLAAASSYSLAAAVAWIKSLGGLAIPAHVDRPAFSLGSQLGFMPPGLDFDALEISRYALAAEDRVEYAVYKLPLIAASDSHFPAEIGSCATRLLVRKPSFAELGLALKGLRGRAVAE